MNEEQLYLNFDEYIKASEPHKRERAEAWRVAIGLQAVDGLQVSEYLKQTARQHIEGEITIDEAREQIKQYYISKTKHDDDDNEMEEADRVSGNIAKLISSPSFTFSAAGVVAIHRAIFEGVFKHAGALRTYDITKKEWVLRGDTVTYGRWQDLRMALDYDIEQEKGFDYRGLSMGEIVEHIAKFISGIWQTHPFCEGNTRTTAVFAIKYLKSIGFECNNDLFEQYSWYFRNALVRANYKNVAKGIGQDYSFLHKFFRNLLMGENHELKNRYMLVNAPSEWSDGTSTKQVPNKYRTSTEQVAIKHNDLIHTENADIVKLLMAIGTQEMSVKQMMEAVALKHRPTFLENYLSPAINGGYIRMLYPDSPRHPRQKYLLTVKGMALYNELKSRHL